ncbi:MAG: hypothetical protein MK105_16280 [Crocinitomicaceae bacterium]|nr:hypothetical protein [Crocinitomicaceae bacterium]
MTRKTYKIIFFLFTLVFIGACSSEQNKTNYDSTEVEILQIEPRVKHVESEINDLLSTVRKESQKFSIYGKRDNLVAGENGTILSIPKGTFVNDRNEVVEGKIEIELIEASTVSDFLMNGLQTVSNEDILQSGGMLYVDAKFNNEPVRIASNKEISVEIKSDWIDPKMKLFKGDLSGNSINWTAPKKLESDYLISVPLELLEFGLCGWECGFTKTQIAEMKNVKFQDTYISTREFEQRMCNLAFLSCEQYDPLDDEILKIYRENAGQNLCHADSAVVEHFEEKYGYLIDSNYIKDEFKFDEKGWITGVYMSYLTLAKQGLTKPLSIKEIDLSTDVSRTELEQKGFNQSEIDKIISYRNSREKVIQEKKDETENRNIASYNFKINELGWMNVDAFMVDPSCQESNFEVVINSQDSINSINVSLVIPRRKVSIFSISNSGNQYSFTKKKDGYRNLPIDEQAFIVAIGVNEGTPFFAMKEIKIPSNGTIKLEMKKVDKELIATKINEISNN